MSRDVKLSLEAMRAHSLAADAPLGADGSNLAAVINRWRSSDPDKQDRLETEVRTCMPEIKRVFAPASANGAKTSFHLEFEQADGQRFDAAHVSDGVLFFTALVAHIVDAGPGALILIEEPENSIHPRRLHDVVDLMRRMRDERGYQFLVATHSTVLLDEFRDEPEAILLFRRGPNGTVVRSLDKVDQLRDALEKTEPGVMLANGFFSEPF
jgi:predicted ATPase